MKYSDNMVGIMLMLGAMAMFAVEDAFIKKLAGGMGTGQILVIIGAGGFAVFALIAKRQGRQVISRDLLLGPVLLRNFGEILGTSGYVLAVVLTPLSSASAILQATPLAVALGAALFLKQAVGWRRWVAIGAGFIGVLIVIRPGLEGFQPASLFAVQGVIGLSIRDLATRAMPGRVSSMVLSAYGFGVVVPAGLIIMLFEGPAVMPDGPQSALIAAALIVGPVGYYMIVAAMRVGEVAVVTPYRYVRLVFAMIIGVLAFGEVLDFYTILGASIIIGSGLFTIYRERLARKAL
ncbi:MAG: EamA family transporter [Rhodobacteraceae bacterium]|nr:EamA family transporter [Paracoccaceae bacterium]